MQITSSKKEKYHIPLTEGFLNRKFKDLFHPILMKLASSAVTFRVEKENSCQPVKGRPIIYVGNHYCGQDVPIAANQIDGRVVVLAGKQNLFAADEFFFNMNGTIFVDRKDKTDMAAAKRAMIAHLKKNQNILVFPEGTSNVTDNLLMLPMKWGIIEVAKEAHAQIIPIALCYDHDEKICRVRFGKSLIMDGIDKKTGITKLRDYHASMRWDFMERKPVLRRSEADIDALRRQNRELLLSYKKLDYEYEQSVIFRPGLR